MIRGGNKLLLSFTFVKMSTFILKKKMSLHKSKGFLVSLECDFKTTSQVSKNKT